MKKKFIKLNCVEEKVPIFRNIFILL